MQICQTLKFTVFFTSCLFGFDIIYEGSEFHKSTMFPLSKSDFDKSQFGQTIVTLLLAEAVANLSLKLDVHSSLFVRLEAVPPNPNYRYTQVDNTATNYALTV